MSTPARQSHARAIAARRTSVPAAGPASVGRPAALLIAFASLIPGLSPQSAAAEPSGISINGTQLPGLRPSTSGSGFAAGAPGLPAAGEAIERMPPGSHGTPPTTGTPQGTHPGPGMGQAPVGDWSEADIRAGHVHCGRVLAGLDAHFTFVPQVKSGSCGAPTPIELSGFGRGLAISPPVVVTCDVAAALHSWMKTQVQPLAKRHLGSYVTQINAMSSYSCRNRYGARNAPLSQHAFANAIDIRGFVTAKGQLLDVEQHWGPTTKELAAYQEAAPAGQMQPSAVAESSSHALVKSRSRGSPLPQAPSPMTTATIPLPGAASQATTERWSTTVKTGPVMMPAAVETAVAAAPVARGPQPKPSFPVVMKASAGEASTIRIVATGQLAHSGPPSVLPGEPLDGRAHFLREVWQGACGPFTTVLGPEANRAHRNHFHVDLAQRKSGAFCQ